MKEPTELDELKQALKKDFNSLLVKEFTTSWEAERIVRGLEIDVMRLTALKALINKSYISRKEVEELLPYEQGGSAMGRNYRTGYAKGWNDCRADIKKRLLEDGNE